MQIGFGGHIEGLKPIDAKPLYATKQAAEERCGRRLEEAFDGVIRR